jgi:microcin C transport system substrate-binding protein
LSARRIFTLLAARALALLIPISCLSFPGHAQEWRHGVSLMGEPKYPAGFKHFDYVNPNASKGGLLRMSEEGSFDTFNTVISQGTPAAGTNLLYDSLMSGSLDEVATEYGLLAESVKFPADFSSVTYKLRAEAKWADGQPVTPEDVIWTFDTLKKLNRRQEFYYRHVVKAEKTGEREITFTFDAPGNRELPQIVGQIVVMPKHWWSGKDANGKQRDIAAGTLEPPLGSGPYRIKSFIAGRTITYERNPNYWGKDLPVNVGKNNIGDIRYEYYRDDTVELEALKADQYDFRAENSAKNWATAYDFPAKREGKVILQTFPERARGIMQAFVFNLRRAKFQDPRVRLAFNYALDFEDMNRTLFFGQYSRINSYFEGSELKSTGLPEGKELEILNTVRDKVPPEVFTKTYEAPKGGTEEARRNNLRQSLRLFKEAGYEVKNGKMTNVKTGEPFTVDILLNSPPMERVALFYKPALDRLGIGVTVRIVDSSQYVNRVRSRDYDIIVTGWAQSLSPGNEQLSYFGSESADRDGSYNFAGIKNPAVDEMIKRVIFAKDRDELIAATKALDRVLLWNQYVVPMWTISYSRTARWDRFGFPEKLPAYSYGFPSIWWYDMAKAEKTGIKQ